MHSPSFFCPVAHKGTSNSREVFSGARDDHNDSKKNGKAGLGFLPFFHTRFHYHTITRIFEGVIEHKIFGSLASQLTL